MAADGKAYISINGQHIRQNIKAEDKVPPIRVALYPGDPRPRNAFEVAIDGPSRLVYDPDHRLLRCGARLVLVVDHAEHVRIIK